MAWTMASAMARDCTPQAEGRERGGGGRGHGGKSDDWWMSGKWSLFPDGAGDQRHASAPFDAPLRLAHNKNTGVEEGLVCGDRGAADLEVDLDRDLDRGYIGTLIGA